MLVGIRGCLAFWGSCWGRVRGPSAGSGSRSGGCGRYSCTPRCRTSHPGRHENLIREVWERCSNDAVEVSEVPCAVSVMEKARVRLSGGAAIQGAQTSPKRNDKEV